MKQGLQRFLYKMEEDPRWTGNIPSSYRIFLSVERSYIPSQLIGLVPTLTFFLLPTMPRRYSVSSEGHDRLRSLSLSRPPSVRSRIRKPPQRHRPTFQPGQICLVEETVFSPLCEALNSVGGPLETRSGLSLTAEDGVAVPVSTGPKRRPCIIMDPPSNYFVPVQNTGHFICLMATFKSSKGKYEELGGLLQRFVVPVEPNEQLLPDSGMHALTTDPAWSHPWQWAISFLIYTERPVRLYTSSRDGQSRRLPRAEYDRLAQHCFNQRALWERDALENEHLKQEMFDQLVVSPSGFELTLSCVSTNRFFKKWEPDDPDNASTYTCRFNASRLSVNSLNSRKPSRRDSNATLHTIVEDATPAYPKCMPPSICEV